MHLCPKGHHTTIELQYYYDDDWGHKGSKVWFADCEAKLYVCLHCKTVFVDDIKKVVREGK